MAAPLSAGRMTVAGPSARFAALAAALSFFATIRASTRAPGALTPTTVSGMAAEEGPSLDWLMAQPYEMWDKARRSERPVIADDSVNAMGPGTFYQITRYKDAETVLRDDKTFSSTINMAHIGQFMGELIVGMDGDEHRAYRNL